MDPEWKYQLVAQFEIADRPLWLGYEKDPQNNEEIFSGGLDANDQPISFKKFTNEILGAAFDLQLPASLPDFLLEEFNARIVKDISYHFEGSADIVFDNPLGLSNDYLSFSQLHFTLDRILPQASEDPNDPPPPEPAKVIIVEADVNRSSQISWFPNASARMIFGDGARVLEMRIFSTLDPAQFIEDLLGISINSTFRQFIPTLRPLDTQDAPMRFYYANQDYNLPVIEEGDSGDPNLSSNGSQSEPGSGGGNPAPATPPEPQYSQGLSLDQTVIEILNQEFLLALDVHEGFNLKANMQPFDLGIFQLEFHPDHAPLSLAQAKGFTGPSLEVLRDTNNSANDSISLHTLLKSFGEDFLIDLSYAQNCFDASVQLTNSLFGVNPGPLDIEWCKDKGFRIKNFPLPPDFDRLLDLLEGLRNVSSGACGALTDLLFEAVNFEPTVHLNVKPEPSLLTGKFYVILGGSWDLKINGHSIRDIEFESARLELDIPTSFSQLGEVLSRALYDNIGILFDALVNNALKFGEVLSYLVLINVSQSLANNILCRTPQLSQIPNTTTTPGPSPPPSVDPIAAGELASTIGLAAEAIPALGALIGFLASLIGWLGIKTSRQKRAERARDRATNVIRSRMTVSGVSAHYVLRTAIAEKKINVSWSQIADPDPHVTWHIRIVSPSAPVEGNPFLGGESTRYSHGGIPKSQLNWTIPGSGIINGVVNKIYVKGIFDNGNIRVEGNETRFDITPPVLSPPQVSHSYHPASNSVVLDWPDVPAVLGEGPNRYEIRMIQPSGSIFVEDTELLTRFIDPAGSPPVLASQGTIALDSLSLPVGPQFEFQARAFSADPDLNSFFGKDALRMRKLSGPTEVVQQYDINATLLTVRFKEASHAQGYRIRIFDADGQTPVSIYTSSILQPEAEDPNNPPPDGKKTIRINSNLFYRISTQNYHAYLQAIGDNNYINSNFTPSGGPDVIRSGVGYNKIGISFKIG